MTTTFLPSAAVAMALAWAGSLRRSTFSSWKPGTGSVRGLWGGGASQPARERGRGQQVGMSCGRQLASHTLAQATSRTARDSTAVMVTTQHREQTETGTDLDPVASRSLS